MFKVAITGGIGSGKSYVARIFETKKIPVYYADKEAKRLMFRDLELKSQIKSLFGKKAYHSNGRLNRPFIASKVFQDSALLAKLNKIVHPAVARDFQTWSNNQKALYVIEESAIIFEIGGQKNFDKTILVTADKATRIRRVIKRDKATKAQVEARMKKQWSDKKKIKLADYIISNNDGDDILKQIESIHKKIIKAK